MKIKIIQDCRLAQLPHQPHLAFNKDQELEIDSETGLFLVKINRAVEIEVGKGEPANDGETQKAMNQGYENKMLKKKPSNKEGKVS